MTDPANSDRVFAGSIPEIYQRYMVPLFFEPYARDIAARVAALHPAKVLELAAGTGVVTRHLARVLPSRTSIVATDLNQAMLDQAAAAGTPRPVEWRQADAMKLPFPDHAFDVVACQFGVMFFPDKAVAFREALRVLRPGGSFVFNVWDSLAHNDFGRLVTNALVPLFPDDPPMFMARIPHGYHDEARIAADPRAGGFASRPVVRVLPERSRASSPRVPAIAICQGTPLRSEIEARDAARLEEATDAAARAIAERFGGGEVDGRMQAIVIWVPRA
jgi:SAM-dependent methyltransferase